MESNDNSIIVNNSADRSHHTKLKNINSLYFNALNNKHRLSKMNGNNNLKLDLDETCLLNSAQKKAAITSNGVTKNGGLHKETICDTNKLTMMMMMDKENNQENLNAKMLRMGGLGLPGLVNQPSRSQPQVQSPMGSPQGFNRARQSLRLAINRSQEEGAHAAATTPPGSGLHQYSPQLPVIRKGSFICSDVESHMSKSQYADAVSIRSLASIGMGSTDGKRMVIRKVPTSPVELLNIVNPPTVT